MCNRQPWYWITAGAVLGLLLGLVGTQPVAAQEEFSQPVPQTSPNGAIHYQRAILFLTAVDPQKRTVLEKPIWEIVTPETNDAEIDKLNQLLIESRHAIRSALVGSNQAFADFGLDIQQYMVTALLPHGQSMVDLAKLTCLVGMHRESEGQWKEAAELYFSTIRMGRHMTHQSTLAEAFAGVEILETAYFSLGQWASRCPDQKLVQDALKLLTTYAYDMVQPARTLQSEANILKLRMEALREAYPDGPWAEIVLETLGADFPVADPEGLKQAAKAAALKSGVSPAAFASKEAFLEKLGAIGSVSLDMLNETSLCLTRPVPEAIRGGEAVASKYHAKLLETPNSRTWEPARIASLFAVHEAELTVLRASMAIAAAKTGDGYPAGLEAAAESLGADLPNSPYDGSPLRYESLENGKGFSVAIPAATVGSVELPEIKFRHVSK